MRAFIQKCILVPSFVFACSSLLFLNCFTTKPTDDTPNNIDKDIEIINIHDGDKFVYGNYILVVIRYNTNKVSVTCKRYFSIDEGKTWKEMTVEIWDEEDIQSNREYYYEVMKWSPDKDGLQPQQKFRIKTGSYANDAINHIVKDLVLE
ncbi:MAG: hypothetical protein JW795_18490 [Chitinivibrionales bacterium]|nr:hypothetical protein [Chitinivibrionales bacterium]